MAIGNLEAIRDWMEDTWYDKDEVMYIINTIGEEYITWLPYYKEDTGQFIKMNGRGYNKPNSGAAYVCGMKYAYNLYTPLIVSKNPNAAKLTTSEGHSGEYKTTVEFMNEIWYCNDGWGWRFDSIPVSPINRLLVYNGADTTEKRAIAFLKHIYGIRD